MQPNQQSVNITPDIATTLQMFLNIRRLYVTAYLQSNDIALYHRRLNRKDPAKAQPRSSADVYTCR